MAVTTRVRLRYFAAAARGLHRPCFARCAGEGTSVVVLSVAPACVVLISFARDESGERNVTFIQNIVPFKQISALEDR